jgi:hypothetical protein
VAPAPDTPAPDSGYVTIPIDIDAVIEAVIGGLYQEAAKGNPAAAREYRAWLNEFGVQAIDDSDLEITSLEDMTPGSAAVRTGLGREADSSGVKKAGGDEEGTAGGGRAGRGADPRHPPP